MYAWRYGSAHHAQSSRQGDGAADRDPGRAVYDRRLHLSAAAGRERAVCDRQLGNGCGPCEIDGHAGAAAGQPGGLYTNGVRLDCLCCSNASQRNIDQGYIFGNRAASFPETANTIRRSAEILQGENFKEHPFAAFDFPGAPLGLYNGFPWFLPFAGVWHKILDWVE